MKHEFKVTRSKEQTVYTIEAATGGSSSTGDMATVDSTLGGMQRRNPPGDNILAQEQNVDEGKGLAGDLSGFLKAHGFKGPYRLGKLPKWAADLSEFDKDNLIMVQGNDVEYDEFVLDTGFGELYMGGEGGITRMTEKAIMNSIATVSENSSKKEEPKPRNFVAKNAKMGGAGQHKDKKKAEKQGDVKHKKPLAESSYAEDLAKQVFDANPNIKDENAVLDAAWPIAVQDLGNKRAMSVFNYDEDFPSDLVSVYGWLQKDQQGVSEEEDKIDSRFKKTEWMPLLDAIKILKHYGATPEKYMGHDMFPYYDREGNRKYLDDISWNADNSKNVRVSLVNAAVRELKTQQQDVAEDHEIQMASSELQSIAKNAVHLLDLVRKYSEEQGLDAWQQSKITKAADYLNSVLQSVSGEQTKLEGVGMPFRGVGGAFNRGDDERHDLDPTEWYIVKDGKMFKTTVYPNQVQKAIAQGFSPSREEAKSKADSVEESADTYFKSLTNMLERSVSQAQHNLMVGVANNPAFAQKVKVKQNVGQEFANADQGHDISKLPIRVPKKK